jgi:hypothetical protein
VIKSIVSYRANHIAFAFPSLMESSAAHRGRHWGMLVVSVETTTRQPFFLDAGAKYGDILFFSKPSGNSACPEMRIETLSWQWRFL